MKKIEKLTNESSQWNDANAYQIQKLRDKVDELVEAVNHIYEFHDPCPGGCNLKPRKDME